MDINGVPLATNRPIINLYWCGTGNSMDNKHSQSLLKKLESILDAPLLTDQHIITSLKYAEKHYKKMLLASDLSFDQLSKIEEQCIYQDKLYFKTNFQRFYPHGSCASHIIGYLQYVGKSGIEYHYEQLLSGETGTMLKTINSVGREIESTELKPSIPGTNIRTTIDINLQKIVEDTFPHLRAGAFIIMDPSDGSIKAFLSRPEFDPNLFLKKITHENWEALQEKNPFLNRGLTACYPPGSLFKLVTASAALEHNMIDETTQLNCPGFVYFGNRKYWCHKRPGHGKLTTIQALAQSCNILFYEIGKLIDIDLLAEYATKFGLGKKTGIIFPEKIGLIPTRSWKYEQKNDPWWPGETLSAAIGQSFLLVTPLQIACMIASIFTGYLVRPRIIQNEEISKNPLTITKKTLDFLKQSMKSVVTKGTGRRINKIKDIEIYAKTSTAQTSSFEKRNLGASYLEHCWFVAYITYKNEKPLTMVILVEYAGSSRIATIAAKNFLLSYKKLIDGNN